MEFVPTYQFQLCVDRYHGNHYVKDFSCWDQFLCLAFAQLTYRASLRDIETCLRAQGTLRVEARVGSKSGEPFLAPRLRGGFAPAWVVQTLPGLNQRGSHSGLYEFGREVRQEQCERLRGTATPQPCQPERCECATVLGRPRQLVLPHVRGREPPAQ